MLRDTDTGLGQYELTDFGYLPDNSIIAIGKSGTVRWLTETGAGRTIGTFTVRTNGDMGLVGLAIAPDFATSHQIYLNREINVSSGQVTPLDIALQIATEAQEVQVSEETAGQVSTDPSQNVGALVLKNEDLDALPDDPAGSLETMPRPDEVEPS